MCIFVFIVYYYKKYSKSVKKGIKFEAIERDSQLTTESHMMTTRDHVNIKYEDEMGLESIQLTSDVNGEVR